MTPSTSYFKRSCQHCGKQGHLVLECHAYSTHIPRYPRRATSFSLPPQIYAFDPGCLSLNYADNFVSLLSTIRKHLYTSTDTQRYYVSIAKEFQQKLGSSCGLGHQASFDDFRAFIVNSWPTFRSIHGPVDKVVWGRVSKQPNSPNEVGVLSSLISAVEVATANSGLASNLPLPLYNLILVDVILHQLMHAFMNHLFNNITTPQAVGPSESSGYDESGWLLEAQLMQGVVSASWDCQDDVGRMELIKRVVLETTDGSVYTINVDTAEKVLRSLGHSHLTPPSIYPLAVSQGVDFRARLTETTSLPKREAVIPIGLGFCSYVGSDRWETPY